MKRRDKVGEEKNRVQTDRTRPLTYILKRRGGGDTLHNAAAALCGRLRLADKDEASGFTLLLFTAHSRSTHQRTEKKMTFLRSPASFRLDTNRELVWHPLVWG